LGDKIIYHNFAGVFEEMNWRKDFLWPFSGLKMGFHEMHIPLTSFFFEELQPFEVLSGKGTAFAKLEKKESMLLLNLSIDSKLRAACDRCGDELEVEVSGNMDLVYKFGEEPSLDETLVVLPKDAFQLDLFQPCFELMVISLPTRFVHDEKDCNPEIIKLLQTPEWSSPDPRWEALKKNN